ncbi:hypothetical protein BG005_003591 [Podila minutissima]|nr:hypothetical protein BG005_003591 [Podila minutissima]
MIANGGRRYILVATATMVITCFSFTPTTVVVAMAQVMPAPVQDMAWVRSGSDLYIEGGYVSLNGEDGKTLIVFGGRTSVVTPTFTGALHLLDIDTGVWTAGPSQSTPRIYAACVLVGDQFVVWGGSADANNTLPSVQPIVFDVTLKQWVDGYKAPAYYLNNPPPKPNPTSGSGSDRSSGSGGTSSNGGASGSSPGSGGSSSVGLGPIIGGIVGGLAVIGAVIGFLLYRRRQNKKLEEVKEQVSQQRMFIEAERSNYAVVHSSNGSYRNDGGGGGGTTSGGGENSSRITSYPMSLAYSPSNNTTTHDQHSKSPSSPHLQHQNQLAAAASSPMSSPAARTPTANNSSNSPHGPQLTQKSGPQAVKMYQPGGGGVVSGPQEYYSPTGRAPQTFNNEAYMAGHYHEQESGRVRQNHPQEGAPRSGYE